VAAIVGVNRRKTYAVLSSGAVLAGALAYIRIADPHNRESVYPICPFKMLTGWNCPACGGLRMTHDLLHADLAAAVVDNVFLLVGIPAMLGWILWRRHAGRPIVTTAAVVVVLVTSIAWTLVRNMPGFPLIPTLYGS
jgi:Protein of unknown function (DUF2752)